MAVPNDILDAYGFLSSGIEEVSGGLINATYCVKDKSGIPVAALQCLHPVFDGSVNFDIEAITNILVAQNIVTPRLIRTIGGEVCAMSGKQVWRAISWIPGKCYAKIPSLPIAEEGGKLIARFHRALHRHSYEFQFQRTGVHDTDAHLRKLRMAGRGEPNSSTQVETLREEILSRATSLPQLPQLPGRIIHGDLKISNLLFDDEDEGLCLIDLDTMARGSIAYELGDALRSWANPNGEDLASPEIDPQILGAVAKGYASGHRGILSADEIASVVSGLEWVSLELAARFCVDVFEDAYFGWDANHFPSRRAHNIVRAKGQLSLSRSVAQNRSSLERLWIDAFD